MTQDENWETEATVRESYDPQAKCAKARVVRRPQGATPSERWVQELDVYNPILFS